MKRVGETDSMERRRGHGKGETTHRLQIREGEGGAEALTDAPVPSHGSSAENKKKR